MKLTQLNENLLDYCEFSRTIGFQTGRTNVKMSLDKIVKNPRDDAIILKLTSYMFGWHVPITVTKSVVTR